LPFCRCCFAVVPFRSDVAVAADLLSSYDRMAKIGFNPLVRNGSYGATESGNGNFATEFFT